MEWEEWQQERDDSRVSALQISDESRRLVRDALELNFGAGESCGHPSSTGYNELVRASFQAEQRLFEHIAKLEANQKEN